MELYNLDNEQYATYIEGLCLANLPIEFYGQYLKQLYVKDILLLGEEEYGKLITPFTLSKEILLENPNTDIFLLDIYSLDEFRTELEYLIKALKLFFNTSDIELWNNGQNLEIIINKNLFLDGNKFEKLRKIILKTNNTRELTKEDLKKTEEKSFSFKDNKLKSEWQLFMEERRRKKESKNEKKKDRATNIINVYNFISNCNNIDYKMPLELTIYQLYNSYNNYHIKDNYNYTMRIATSGMVDSKDLDLTPLSQRMAK